MKKKNLKLVINCNNFSGKNFAGAKFIQVIKNYIDCFFVSENKKIYIIKNVLINIYRDYEKTTGVSDIPYIEKAEKRICKIINDNKINYYYNKLKRFKDNRFY